MTDTVADTVPDACTAGEECKGDPACEFYADSTICQALGAQAAELQTAYERGVAEGRAKAAAFIANEIRCELVCCNIYDLLAPIRARMEASDDGGIAASAELEDAIGVHDICYWGEAAARIADPWSTAEEAPDA